VVVVATRRRHAAVAVETFRDRAGAHRTRHWRDDKLASASHGHCAGSAAWALGWWGGADSIALATLGLWQGLIGLIVGAIATAVAGLLVMVFRRRAFIGLLSVLPEAIA
jgi:hypothetical protein